MDIWTNEDIEKILIQLNKRSLPFRDHEFSGLGKGLVKLGSGGMGSVYEAHTRLLHQNSFAVKVMGFQKNLPDHEEFRQIVELQKKLSEESRNIVRIYDHVQLKVYIQGENTVGRAEVFDGNADLSSGEDCLYLQFILMEKLIPVVEGNKYGRCVLSDTPLKELSESSVTRFACDIAQAVENSHSCDMLHRDIKLENAFYSIREDCYKLGDFGVAKIAERGVASSAVFTKGYCAPEVIGAAAQKYDCTADIYSFGMMLFLLLNELKFPDSGSYRVNLGTQYSEGYKLPGPVNGSEELCLIIGKMCSFYPEQRYQSVREFTEELSLCDYGYTVMYRKKHKDISLVLGLVFLLSGAAVWEISFLQGRQLHFSVAAYLLLGSCIWKGAAKLFGKNMVVPSVLALGAGVFLLITGGFSVWKALLFIYLAVLGDFSTGVFALSVLVLKAVNMAELVSPDLFLDIRGEKWAAVLLLLIGASFCFYHFVLKLETDQSSAKLVKMNYFAVVLCLVSLILLMVYATYEINKWNKMKATFPDPLTDPILAFCKMLRLDEWEPLKVGAGGLLLSLVWLLRDGMLVWMNKIKDAAAYVRKRDGGG